MLRRVKAIEGMDLSYERRKADEKVWNLESARGVDLDCALGEYERSDAVYCAYRYYTDITCVCAD